MIGRFLCLKKSNVFKEIKFMNADIEFLQEKVRISIDTTKEELSVLLNALKNK